MVLRTVPGYGYGGAVDVMPKAAAKNCKRPGCGNRTHGAYCDQHKRPAIDNRPSARERGYGATWEKLRRMVLAREPLCRHCKRGGRTTVANEVDHIKPLSGGGTNHMDNLQPLCKSCHSRKTASERHERGRAGQIPESRGRGTVRGVSRIPRQKSKGGSAL